MTFTDKQITDFLELAEEVGITKAKRELGYPKSWSTAQRWADLRGVKVETDEVKMRAANTREWYKDEEMVVIAQEGMNRVYEDLMNKVDISADDQAKLAKAYSSYLKDILTVQGRSSQITETRSNDTSFDAHIEDLLFNERKKNQDKKGEQPAISSSIYDVS